MIKILYANVGCDKENSTYCHQKYNGIDVEDIIINQFERCNMLQPYDMFIFSELCDKGSDVIYDKYIKDTQNTMFLATQKRDDVDYRTYDEQKNIVDDDNKYKHYGIITSNALKVDSKFDMNSFYMTNCDSKVCDNYYKIKRYDVTTNIMERTQNEFISSNQPLKFMQIGKYILDDMYPLDVINVHFFQTYNKNREIFNSQIEMMCQYIRENPNTNILIAGDFNINVKDFDDDVFERAILTPFSNASGDRKIGNAIWINNIAIISIGNFILKQNTAYRLLYSTHPVIDITLEYKQNIKYCNIIKSNSRNYNKLDAVNPQTKLYEIN